MDENQFFSDFSVGTNVDANAKMWQAIRDMFDFLDQDRSGSLTWDEFEAAVAKKKASGASQPADPIAPALSEELRSKFDSVDTDKSGKVSKEELAKLLNDDAAFRDRVAQSGMNPDFYVLEQMDGDADGKLTYEELEAALKIG